MNVATETIGQITVIRPRGGDLDAGRVKEFRRDVIDRLTPDSQVLLDLSELRFIESSGFGAILACSRRVCPDGDGPGDLKLCGATKPVRMVFEMVRLHKVIEIYNSREEGLRAFEPDFVMDHVVRG